MEASPFVVALTALLNASRSFWGLLIVWSVCLQVFWQGSVAPILLPISILARVSLIPKL